jgi:TonB family protein
MRFDLPSSVRLSAIAPSTAISFAAHALFIGAAVYGTGVNARELEERQAKSVYYLPPPDRHPSARSAAERLQYVDIGGGSPDEATRADGMVPRTVGLGRSDKSGGAPGQDADAQLPTIPVASADSVFSVLDVEESAVRSQGSAAPLYPPDLVKAGVEGGVYIRFVVDTSGHPDSNSMEVVRSSHPAFTESVRLALPLMLFTPATVRGHHVRQAVEQNFEFKILIPETVLTTAPKQKP